MDDNHQLTATIYFNVKSLLQVGWPGKSDFTLKSIFCLFCFGSLVTSDAMCRYLSLFVLYVNIEIGVVCRYLPLFVLYINIEIGKNRC